MLTIEDLEDELTEDQALDELLERLEAAGFPATSWEKFSIPRITVHLGAHILAKLSSFVAFVVKMAFNDTSESTALTRFSASAFQNTRQPAVATQGRAVLACETGEGPHSINVGDFVFTDPTGNTFRNIAGLGVTYPATLSGGAALPLLFEAEVPGESANIATSTTLSPVTTLAGVTVTNPPVPGTDDWKTVVGVNEESDAALRVRNSAKWGELSQFELIADSVESIALNAADAISVVAVNDQNPRGAGTFDVYLAAEAATAGADDVTAVQAALAARVMGSDAVRTYAAPIVALNLTGVVYYNSKYQSADVQSAVEETQLLEFIKTIPLGGFDYSPGPANVVPKNDVETEIKNTEINGAKIIRTVTLSTPASDLAVASFGKVIRGTYSLTYTAVP